MNPLILYPGGPLSVDDFGFVAGAFGGADQWTVGGATTPTAVTGQGEDIGYAVKINAVAGSSFVRNLDSKNAYANDSNQVYIYARVKATSGTGSFTFRLAFYDSGVGYVYSDNLFVTLGSAQLPVDSEWHIIKKNITWQTYYSLVNARYVAFEEVGAISGTTDTYTAYIDWITMGHSLDGADLVTLSGRGAMAVHPFKYGSTAAGTFGKNVAGAFSARRFHAGYRTGSLQFTPFAQSELYLWDNFIDYAADGSRFTVFYDQSEAERDFVKNAVLNMDSDGLEQVAATPHWRGTIDWREVP